MQQVFSGIKTATFELPLPPTINGGYWGFKGHRRFLTDKAKEFQAEVFYAVVAQTVRFRSASLEMTIVVNFKDKRVQDISNRVKALEDAFVHAGLMDDDSQIKILHVYEGPNVKGGKCTVRINSLPFNFSCIIL